MLGQHSSKTPLGPSRTIRKARLDLTPRSVLEKDSEGWLPSLRKFRFNSPWESLPDSTMRQRCTVIQRPDRPRKLQVSTAAFKRRQRYVSVTLGAIRLLTRFLQGLGYGVYDGVTGIFTQPVRGAREEGVAGFFKGVGRGLGGSVFKPGAGECLSICASEENTDELSQQSSGSQATRSKAHGRSCRSISTPAYRVTSSQYDGLRVSRYGRTPALKSAPTSSKDGATKWHPKKPKQRPEG